MNPLDYIPKFVWAALVAVLAATSCKLKIENGSLSLEVEKHATRIAELREGIATSNAQAAVAGAAMETRVRAATQAAAVRERALVADRARAVTELDGLRMAVAQAQGGFGLRPSANTTGTAFDYTDTLADLFVQCSSRYVDVAAKADGHVSDIKTLTESWPK